MTFLIPTASTRLLKITRTPSRLLTNLSAADKQQIAQSLQKPGFVGSSFNNGSFAFAGDAFDGAPTFSSNMIPGWSQHGGGGTGYAVQVGINSYALELGPAGSYRTHNRSYIDESIGGVTFDWRKTKSGSSTDLLAIEVNGIQIGSINSAAATLGNGTIKFSSPCQPTCVVNRLPLPSDLSTARTTPPHQLTLYKLTT